MTRLWSFGSGLALIAGAMLAQDFPPDIFDTRPLALDPAHFRLVLENERVQVIRVRLGPHEKSTVMEIPGHVATYVTGQHVRLNFAHSKPKQRSVKAGESVWIEREECGIENLEDKPAEWILVIPKEPEHAH